MSDVGWKRMEVRSKRGCRLNVVGCLGFCFYCKLRSGITQCPPTRLESMPEPHTSVAVHVIGDEFYQFKYKIVKN
jgi:hypothetical protein